MTKKHRQPKKAKKTSKRTEAATKPDDEINTESMSASTEVPQAARAIPDAEVAVESQQPVTSVSAMPATPQANLPEGPVDSQNADAVATEAAGSETAPKATRSGAAKANIKEGLRLHQIAASCIRFSVEREASSAGTARQPSPNVIMLGSRRSQLM
jgi:hypothetical protein